MLKEPDRNRLPPWLRRGQAFIDERMREYRTYRRAALPLWVRDGLYVVLAYLKVWQWPSLRFRVYEWIWRRLPPPVQTAITRELERARFKRARFRFWRGEIANRWIPPALLQSAANVMWFVRRTRVFALEAPAMLARYADNNLAGLLTRDTRPALLFVPEVTAHNARQFSALARATGRERVAFVTVDRATKQKIAGYAPDAPVFSMQDYWIDSDADLRIHVAAHEHVAALERAAGAEANSLLDLLTQGLFGQAVQGARLGEALMAAVRTGADIIVIAPLQDFLGVQYCRDVVSEVAGRQFQAYEAIDLHYWLLGRPILYDDAPPVVIAKARQFLKIWSTMRLFRGTDRIVRPAPRNDRTGSAATIAVCSEARTTMPYWAGLDATLTGAAERGRRAVLFTRSREAADRIRRAGFLVRMLKTSGPVVPRGFLPGSTALVDAVDAELGRLTPGSLPTIERLVRRTLLLRLLDRAVLYRIMNELRSVESLADEFQRQGVDIVVTMPHWSDIGAFAAAAAHKVGAMHSSMPVVSVSGTRASLVGWDKVDLIGCYGEQCVEAFRAIGTPQAHLRLVGNIALDKPLRLTRAAALARNPDLRKFLDGAQTTILVATSAIDPDEIVWFQELGRAVAALPNGRILLRPHPSFGIRAYRDFVAVGGGADRCSIFTKPPIHDLIRAADVVITDYSTVGAEAVLMGKQLLIVNCTGKRFPVNNYDEHGVALIAHTPGEIEDRLRKLLLDPDTLRRIDESRAAFARRYNWMNDGHAAARYIDALIEHRERMLNPAPEETACPSAPVSASSPARAPSSVS